MTQPNKSPDKFELTTDYIQQTIQQALQKDNLSPEIEQKLLALQQHNQEHDPPPVIFSYFYHFAMLALQKNETD